MTRVYLPKLPNAIMFVKDRMTIEWQEFFRTMFLRVGGVNTPDLDTMVNSIINLNNDPTIDYTKQIEELEFFVSAVS